jgi:iron complex outermembrane receptor protein
VYTHYEHDEIADGVNGQTYRNEEFEGRLEMFHDPLLGFVGAVGLHGSTRDFKAEGEATEFLAPTDTRMFSLYTFEEHEIVDDLTAEFGFRIEHTNVDGRDISGQKRDRDFVPLSGAIGLVATPLTGLTIGLNGAINQRAPSQVELFARGAHEATQTFEIGDSRLDEETSYATDLRVAMKGSRGRIEWAAFATRYENYIYGAFTGGFVDEDGNAVAPGTPGALQELRYVERDAVFYGTEVSGELDVLERDWGRFGVDGQFDFVRARFTNGSDRNLPRIVPIRWGGGVFFRSTAFDARVGFRRTEAQNKVAAFERPSKSFTFLNASLVYRLDLFGDGVPLELSVVGRNLTDVRGRNHVAFNNQEVLLPGRDIRFGLRVQF